MAFLFRKAESEDQEQIWNILQQAIKRRKADGSKQWQDGYPNAEVVLKDIQSQHGYVLTEGEKIIGYAAVLINDEPAYAGIQGKWLTDSDFVVVHRIAIADEFIGKGLAQQILRFIEEFALLKNIHSIKLDTNFDNPAMMKTFEKLGYVYCGEVFFRGNARRAYEKLFEQKRLRGLLNCWRIYHKKATRSS